MERNLNGRGDVGELYDCVEESFSSMLNYKGLKCIHVPEKS